SLVEDFAKDWPLGRLMYVFEPRQGKQFALNRAVQVTSNEILAFTDDDIDLPPNWLLEIQRLFSSAQVDLAGGKTLIRWGARGKPGWFA
ncbi:glycosyltransferase, partial [Klebsiella pneumoniae]|uniref:glycosyltransferase n=1 Tax=Klebsiella pneumoniae TaxID=573 RepID=UPI0027319D9D